MCNRVHIYHFMRSPDNLIRISFANEDMGSMKSSRNLPKVKQLGNGRVGI